MKVVYCLAGTFNPGGMERIVIKKANWLANNNFDVVIITTEQQGRKSFFDIDGKIKCIDLGINYSDSQDNFIKKALQRRRKLNIHKQRLSTILKAERPQITISTFGNEVFFLYKINDGSKKIVEIHFSRWFRLQMESRHLLWKVVNIYLTLRDRHYVKRYNAFVCLTNEDKGYWGGLNNIRVIPNFIDDSSKARSSLSSKRVISVGRLEYQKGYDRLIKAWKAVNSKCPDWRLCIFGSGSLKVYLLNLITVLGVEKSVDIYNSTTDIYKEYIDSSFLVMSSRYEGLPMVILEAMDAGLPIVSFDCKCGPRDLIKNGINGYIVPNGDIAKLSDRIVELIENQELRNNMGEQSRLLSNKYRESAIMPKWVSLFNECIESCKI